MPLRSGAATAIRQSAPAFSNPSWSSVIKLTGTVTPNVLVEAAFNFDGNKITIRLLERPTRSHPDGPEQSFFPQAADALNRLPSVNLGSYGTAFDPWSQPWKNAAYGLRGSLRRFRHRTENTR